MLPDTLITTYLEMTSQAEFRPSYNPDPALLLLESRCSTAQFYRFLYNGVGQIWHWRDRNFWSDEQLEQQLALPSTRLWVLYVSGTPAGYVELDHQGHQVEVAYFGLMPAFLGRGYGKHLLSVGIARAWESRPERVWVHTCNLDGPQALPTYQKVGFRVYQTEQEPMPERYR
jgi:GNAT superfamily N-acetyltransferase